MEVFMSCKICGKEVEGKRKTCSTECRNKLCGLARKGKATYFDENGNHVSLTSEEAKERGLRAVSSSYVWNEESRKKFSELRKGKRPHSYSEEMREKVGNASRERFTDIEFQKKFRKSMEDAGIWIPLDQKDEYHVYFKECNFKHGFQTDNAEELKLLDEYGVFHYIKNTKGCVRDHLLSRRYGFENGIDPEIISHPANCEIVLHSENIRRRFLEDDNQITLTELYKRIDEYERRNRK